MCYLKFKNFKIIQEIFRLWNLKTQGSQGPEYPNYIFKFKFDVDQLLLIIFRNLWFWN